MSDFGTRISRLSPEALDMWKRDLLQKTKDWSPQKREQLYARWKGIPGLEDLVSQPEAPPDVPMWQKGLQTISKPFEWVHEHIEEPFAAVVTSPFTPSVGGGVPGESWLARERREYEQWEEPEFTMPWGGKFRPTKGVVESLPWFALPSAAGVAGKLGIAARAGGKLGRIAGVAEKAMKPAVAVERAVAYPITKPLEMLGKKLTKVLPETARFAAPANEVIEKTITKDDWQRRVAQWFGRKPFFKSITEAVGGKAATVKGGEAVEDVTTRALLIGTRVQETLATKRSVAMANLRTISPDPVRLFGIDEVTGLAKGIKGRTKGVSKAINDIAEHPTSYILNKEQKAYIQEVHNIEDWVLNGLKEAGVEVKELSFDEFSHWVHRVVLGRKVDGKLVELNKGFGRIGSHQSFEKTRFYNTAAEGMEKGIVYSPNLEQSVELYIQSAAKRVADKRIAEIVAPFGKKPLERMPLALKEESARIGGRSSALKQISTLIEHINAKRDINWHSWLGIKNSYPEQYAQLRAISKAAEEVPQALKTFVVDEKEVVKGLARQFKPGWRKAMEIAKTPSLGTEATIWHPAFQGKIYPKGVADSISEYWADRGFSAFQKAATISGAMRTMVAAADFSAMFIQGLPGIALHPKAWARGAVMSFKAFKDPKIYQQYLVKEMDSLMRRIHYGGYVGGFEYMEAMPTLQKIARMAGGLAGKPRAGEAVVRQTYGRFEASFGAFGDVFRNEMWKALESRAKDANGFMEIARHIDRMSGVMSSKGLGLGRTQRDFESGFLFFAPRYTRAGFALVGDIFKGGLTGAEARKALGSMMAAGAAYYVGVCRALGQEPNFDASTGRFMTIEITDPITETKRHFGIGGMMTSLVRFGADATASALSIGMNEPLDFVTLSRYDNPFMRFMYSKSAPLTGFLTGMVEGKNYFGEPFENAGDYGMFMAEQVMPIAAQAMLMEEGGLAPTAIVGEELGMRTFPMSDWEKRDEVRDSLAQEKYGMAWEDLGTRMGKLYQLQLERDNPELQAVTELASETSSKMARGEGKTWDEWKKEGNAFEDRYQKVITLASQEYRTTGDGITLREKVDEAATVRRAMYANRERNPQYQEIYDYFNEPLEPDVIAKMNPKDLARREYYKMLYSPDMYDEFGNFRFDEADRRESLFVKQYGQAALDYTQEYMGARWEEPTAVKVLREAREVLQPYWDVADQIWANYPPELRKTSDQIQVQGRGDSRKEKRLLLQSGQAPLILWIRRMIALQRRMMKLQNPQMAEALSLFYGY